MDAWTGARGWHSAADLARVWAQANVPAASRQMSHYESMPAQRFWGALVVSRLVNKPPLNFVEVTPSEVVLHRLLRGSETIRRTSVVRVEIRRGRRPFDWTSYVAFIDIRGKRIGELFRPARVQRVRRALLDHGWPVSSAG